MKRLDDGFPTDGERISTFDIALRTRGQWGSERQQNTGEEMCNGMIWVEMEERGLEGSNGAQNANRIQVRKCVMG